MESVELNHPPTQPVSPFTSEAKMLRYYYQHLGKQASWALAMKARRGECLGPAPTGYINVQTPDGPRVEIHPKLGPLVRRAFELAARGFSLRSILGELTPKGLVSRNGKPMGPSSLLNVLTNPFYIGLIRYKGQCCPGTHTLIVSRPVFERAQQRFQQRQRDKPY